MTPLNQRLPGARYPWISRLYYAVQRKRQYLRCRVDRSLTDRRDLLDALLRDGVVICQDFVARDVCERILAETEPSFELCRRGRYTGPLTAPEPNHWTLRECDRLSATARDAFFRNATIDGLAKAYVSKDVISDRMEIESKESIGQALQGELVHFDDWRHRLKAFLYVVDVGEDSAPFAYYAGSHKAAPWRERYELEFEFGGPRGRFGHFFPQEMRDLLREHGFREVVCTGRAGTLILADTRGLHRGTPLRAGRRVMLNKTYTMPAVLL